MAFDRSQDKAKYSTVVILFSLSSMLVVAIIYPSESASAAAPGFIYDESKSPVDNALDNCASPPGWLTSLKSLVQMSPSKEKCDEVMVALYKFCYTSVGVLEGLAEGFGRTIQPGSLAGNVKEKCSDERILNYGYPDWFQNIINERNLNQHLINK